MIIITQTRSNLEWEWPSRSPAAAGLRFSVYIFWKSPVAGAGARCLQHVGYARVQSDIHIPSSIVLYIHTRGRFYIIFFFWRLRFNNYGKQADFYESVCSFLSETFGFSLPQQQSRYYNRESCSTVYFLLSFVSNVLLAYYVIWHKWGSSLKS